MAPCQRQQAAVPVPIATLYIYIFQSFSPSPHPTHAIHYHHAYHSSSVIFSLQAENASGSQIFHATHSRALSILKIHFGRSLYLGCIEYMRCRLLLLMVAMSVCLSVTRQVGGACNVCGGHLVQPLPNYFGLLFRCSFHFVTLFSFQLVELIS